MVVCLVPTTVFAATQTADSWSGLQSLMNGTGDLSVTLSNDISWGGSSLTVPTGKTVTLDLNGKAIDAQSNGTVIAVNGTLTIKNSGADLAGPIGVGAGPITGNIKNGKASDKEAGGILVADGGKLVMNSGWVTNCVDGSGKTSAAGGIYVSKNAVFEMTGGIITGCVGSDLLCAAGVVNYGTFTMSGNATISGSKTGYNSDGVAICNAGIFDANGGTVQTGQKCVNYATVQNTEKSATVFYCNVLNTGLGTIKGGTYHYPVENAGTITGGTFNEKVTSSGTINDGIFKGTVDNTGVVTGGTFNGTTTGIYTVTFGSGVPSQIRANCPATAPDSPTKRGYIFNGWLNGGTPYDFTQNVTQNIHLTADWTPKSYTVKFDTNGGTAIADKTLTWDDKVLDGVSDPEKPGYDFAGWTFDGGNVLTRTTYANLAADDTVTSITLAAQWTLHLYTVTLDANGGTFDASGSTVERDTMQITYGGNFNQMPIPRYKGYFFRGWYDEKWGGRQYGDEDGHGTYTYDKTEDCTLYAMWEEAPLCTVTFDPNGGTLTGAETCRERQNECIQRPYEEPIREGYYFRGWYKDADCTQRWDFDDPIPGNMTLYAGWDILSYVIRVRLENGEQDIIINQNYGTPVTVPDDPTREGYTFIGWNVPFPDKMPAKITTITAQWKINQYTITFDTAGGSEIADKTNVKWTDKALEGIDDPTRNGYEFIGWTYNGITVNDETLYADIAENDSVTSIILKARWRDVESPTGEIVIGTNRWNQMLNNITFGLFFKETQTVTINAADNGGEQVKVRYLLADRELTALELSDAMFTEYTGSFNIDPDNEYIIYAMLSDTAGNGRYISSEGMVLDGTAPVIDGVENGKTYCDAQTVTVTEKYLYTVTVNRERVMLDEQGSFVISPADGRQTIVVTDKAGNSTEMTVTVNDGHTFDEWSSNGDGTHTRRCTVDGCTDAETDNCDDGDKNHKCDVCDATLSEHTDTDKDHICDYCNETTSDHVDTDKNHICDYCNETTSDHVDTDKNHICDYCNETLSECADENKDHKCDYCGETLSECADENKDHKCDYCGATLSECADENKDHKCDYCGATLSECADDNKDHKCDYCGATLSECADENKDHKCDVCDATLSEHTDTDKDHICDYCGETLSECIDADNNHICDICGNVLSDHIGGKATCKDKAICGICGKAYGELDTKNHPNLVYVPEKAAKGADGNIEYWYCEDCNKYYSDSAADKEITKADTITAKLPDDQKPPKTGDNSNLVLWIALLFIGGGAGIGITGISRKKKRGGDIA